MFAFETLTLGEPKDGIEWCPRRQKCQVGGEEFTVADFEMAARSAANVAAPASAGLNEDCVPGAGGAMREAVEKKVLNANDRLAVALRQRYRDERILCANLVSSPGSGKTMLLEKTVATFPKGIAVAVLTGDLQTDNELRRLARCGFPVRQIVTGGTCHLDARMVDRRLNEMGFRGPGILFIENVGNLVCPSSYDLREEVKIVLLSVTEGEDKAAEVSWNFLPFRTDDFDEDRSVAARRIQRGACPRKGVQDSSGNRHHCAIGAHRRGLGHMDGVAGCDPTEGAAPSRRRDHLTLDLSLP
jgi:hydrogenase accessory protein HypB